MTRDRDPADLPLPKSLRDLTGAALDLATRRQLARLTGDGRARLLDGLVDGAQPLPHRGVLLRGRRVAGWVVRIGREAIGLEDGPGTVVETAMEALVPAPAEPELVRDFAGPGCGGCLRPLAVHRRVLVDDGAGGTRDRAAMTWDGLSCADLVRALGLVEVVDLEPRLTPRGVLVPDDGPDWRCIPLAAARDRAADELREPAFWTLPRHAAAWSLATTPALALESIGDYVSRDGRPAPGTVTGLVAIRWLGIHPARGPLRLEAKRRYDDLTWTIELGAPGDAVPAFETYGIVDGALAIALAEQAVSTGRLPAVPPAADVEAARAAFADIVAAAHRRRHRLGFVRKSLGMDEPLAAAC